MLRSISIFSGILPIIFFCLFLRRNKEGSLWVIFLYCLMSFSTDALFPLHFIPGFYLYSSITIIEYSLFSLFLYLHFKNWIFKGLLILGSAVFYFFAIVSILHSKVENFDSIPASVESVLMLIYCIIFLYEQINDPKITFIYYTKEFWVIIAFFIYFSATFFLFIYAANLTKMQHKNYWGINMISNILNNVLFTVSFIIKQPEPNDDPLERAPGF